MAVNSLKYNFTITWYVVTSTLRHVETTHKISMQVDIPNMDVWAQQTPLDMDVH